jgi:hypothetical protein
MDIQYEIQETIKVYKLALKPETLNIEYCRINNIDRGICKFCKTKEYTNLQEWFINNGYKFTLITLCPHNLACVGRDNPTELRLKHEHRIKFLENLLTYLT